MGIAWGGLQQGAHFSAMVKGLTALEMSAQCSSSASRNWRSSGDFQTSGAGCAAAPLLLSRPSPIALPEGVLSALRLALMAAAFSSWNTSSCAEGARSAVTGSSHMHCSPGCLYLLAFCAAVR